MGIRRILSQWRERRDGTLEGPAIDAGDLTINEDWYYAADDAELSDLLNTVADGDSILLGANEFTEDHTFDKRISVYGAGGIGGFGGSEFTGAISVDVAASFVNVRFPDATITVNGSGVYFNGSSHASSAAPTMSIGGTGNIIQGFRNGDFTFTAGASECIIDTCAAVNVTDNGTANIVGDIS